MARKHTSDADTSRSVGLLISILVCYPELGTIHFDPRRRNLKFTFLLTRRQTEAEFEALESKLRASLEAYSFLAGRPVNCFELSRSALGEITVLEVTRDVATLSREEIALIIALMRESYGTSLVAERSETIMDEDITLQEELIEEMLEDLRQTRGDKNLIALREEGRVMVFNK